MKNGVWGVFEGKGVGVGVGFGDWGRDWESS